MIVCGLYLVLWGKNKETEVEKPTKETDTTKADHAKEYERNDLELQLQVHSKSDSDVMG